MAVGKAIFAGILLAGLALGQTATPKAGSGPSSKSGAKAPAKTSGAKVPAGKKTSSNTPQPGPITPLRPT